MAEQKMDMKAAAKKSNKKERQSMTAKELTLLSSLYGVDAINNFDLMDDAQSPNMDSEGMLSYDDQTTETERAESMGFFKDKADWVHLFTKKVDFMVNGTRFAGKDGYQVRGGAVPLQKGLTIDFTPVQMIGKYKNKLTMSATATGTSQGPKLIYYNPEASVMIEIPLDAIAEIGLNTGQPYLKAKTDQSVEIKKDEHTVVKGDGMNVDLEKAEILSPQKQTDENNQPETTALFSAEIGENGLVLTEVSSNPQTDTSKEGTEKTQSDKKETKEDTLTDEKIQKTLAGSSAIVLFTMNADEASEPYTGYKDDDGDNFVEYNSKPKAREKTEEEKKKEKEEKEKKEAEEKAKKEKWKQMSYKEKLSALYDEAKSKYKDAMLFLHFTKDAFLQFWKDYTLPDPGDYVEKEEEPDPNALNLDVSAKIPVIPPVPLFLKFSLSPFYSIGLSKNVSAKSTGGLNEVEAIAKKHMPEIYNTLSIAPMMEEILSKLSFQISAELGITGKVGVKLGGKLSFDAGYLFEAYGGVEADGTLKGIGGNNSLATIRLTQDIGLQNGDVSIDKRAVDLHSGLNLTGSLGASAGVKSKLFSWEKKLWSTEFASWDIAQIIYHMNLEAKNPASFELSDLLNFEMVQQGFSFSVLNKEIAGQTQNKYGINLVKSEAGVGTLLESADNGNKKLEELFTEYQNLRSVIFSKDSMGNYIVGEKNEPFENIKGNMKRVQENIRDEIQISLIKVLDLQAKRKEISTDKSYIANMKKLTAGIEKHESLLKSMQDWGKQFDTSSKNGIIARNANSYFMYRFFKSQKTGKDLEKQTGGKFDKQAEIWNQDSAKKEIGTRQNLLDYENQRQKEKAGKKEGLLKDLRAYLNVLHLQDLNVKSPKFTQYYFNLLGPIDRMSAKRHLSRYVASKAALVNFEKLQMDQATGKHTDRIQKLMTKAAELGIDDKMDQPSAEFTNYYRETLGAEHFFKDALHTYGNVDRLIAYEEGILHNGTHFYEKKTKKHFDIITGLKECQKQMEAIPKEDIAKRSEIQEKALRIMFGNDVNASDDTSYSKKEFLKESYRFATKEDLLAYEKNWISSSEKKREKMRRAKIRYESFHKLVEDSKTGKITKEQYVKEILNEKKNYNFYDTIKELDEKTIRTQATVEDLIDYEDKRISKYKKSGKNESEIKHQLRRDALAERYKYLNSINDPKKKAAVEKSIVDSYFKGELGKKENEKASERTGFVKNIKDAKVVNLHMLELAFEQKYAAFTDKHGKRVEGLKALSEDVEGMDAWDAYRDLGGGDGFKEYWQGKIKGMRLGDFSIESLIQFAESKLRTASRGNTFSYLKKKITNSIKNYFGKGVDDDTMKEYKRGGEYRRLELLKEWKSKGPKEGQTEEEFNREIADRYEKELQGGNGFQKYVKKNGDNMITPNDILRYEQSRVSEKGKTYADRIQFLNTLSDSDILTQEQRDQYIERVMNDQSLSTIRKKLSFNIDFDTSANAEEICTPASIMEYEEKQYNDLAKKHKERIDLLNDTSIPDAEIWDRYLAVGAGKGFLKSHSSEINQKASKLDQNSVDTHSYDRILLYEEDRLKQYQEMKNQASEKVDALEKKIQEVQGMITKAEELITDYDSIDFDQFFNNKGQAITNLLDQSKRNEEDINKAKEIAQKAEEEAQKNAEELTKTV